MVDSKRVADIALARAALASTALTDTARRVVAAFLRDVTQDGRVTGRQPARTDRQPARDDVGKIGKGKSKGTPRR